MEPGTVATLALGFLLGMAHALDADHVVAVSTMVGQYRTLRRVSLVGVFWGLGHTTTLLLAGVAVILFKVRVPGQLTLPMELAVGVVLVLLGASVLREYLSGRVHAHPHRHGREDHVHFHSHAERGGHDHEHVPRGCRRSLLVGMVHGLAGSAALMLLVLTTIRSPALGLAYILIFGGGSILGMLGVSSALGLPFVLTADRHAGAHRSLRIAAGGTSVVYGLWIILSVGIGYGLFR